MNKQQLIAAIITRLEADLDLFTRAAKAAHEAATHEECAPDNKYDTTALEASYIAQGQANRAQEIRRSIDCYRGLKLMAFDDETCIRLTALVTLEDQAANLRTVFIGPRDGGMNICADACEVMVITPGSPLGRGLLGMQTGDEVTVGDGGCMTQYTVVSVL